MLFYPSHKCKKKEFDWLGSGGTLDHLRKDGAGRLWGWGLESAISVCVCVGGMDSSPLSLKTACDQRENVPPKALT